MRDLDLTSLRLFVTVCDTGNMSRAAESSGMVASAVSKRLAQLERNVGAPLLARKGRGVTPTMAGDILLQHARSMLLSASRITRDLASQAAGGVQGRVNLLATASVMAESLIDDISAFLQLPGHQNIRIDLEERVSPDVVRGVREGAAALGICWDAAETGLLQCRAYRQDHLCVAVPRGHPLAQITGLRFADTLDHEHVCLPVNSAVEVMLQREAGLLGRRMQQRVIVTNFEAALRVVRSGEEQTGFAAATWQASSAMISERIAIVPSACAMNGSPLRPASCVSRARAIESARRTGLPVSSF